MRRCFIIFVSILLCSALASAGGVGISPTHYKEFFKPNLKKSFDFHSFNSNPDKKVRLYIKGDLAEFVNLSKESLDGSGEFTATVNLPYKIDKPGTHTIYIGAMEDSGKQSSTVGGITAVQGRIDILVPYPGKYAESTFKISNINEKEPAEYELEVQNLGTQELQIKPTIEIYKNNMTEKVLTKKLKEESLEPKKIFNLIDKLETQNLSAGEYQALAIIDWGEKEKINQTFRIGEFLVEVADYDYQFKKNSINPFNIEIKNKWNTKIDKIFADVSITDNGKLLQTFRTISVDTSPWETKNLTGYFDTTGLEKKRYTANIILSYGGKSSSKLVAIYIIDSNNSTKLKYIIAGIIISIIIILAFLYLILKIRKLKRKNEKKK